MKGLAMKKSFDSFLTALNCKSGLCLLLILSLSILVIVLIFPIFGALI